MDKQLKDQFIERWQKYFGAAELPITFYYSDDPADARPLEKPKGHHCFIADLNKVRNGESIALNGQNIGCGGGLRYTGFSQKIRPNFNYFLSCGIPLEMEGERYKRKPELVSEMMKDFPDMDKKGQWLVFKRWDQLTENDNPEVVIFFATPDIMSGLFMLANFDYVEPYGVKTPFCSGCGSIVLYPYQEKNKENPQSIIGMFDPSARPYVPKERFTFATPMKRFEQLIGYMDESFLITDTWKTIHKRICNTGMDGEHAGMQH
ncbi:MAG: DUF169 domain-containing protein [Bacteroidales bacterium]|nr:DUF169 domain-containing protein [Bacteroidales bacterium]